MVPHSLQPPSASSHMDPVMRTSSKPDFAIFATVQSMAHRSENGSEKKMAEGGNDAELLKEKANKYFKGTFDGSDESAAFGQRVQQTRMSALITAASGECERAPRRQPGAQARLGWARLG